MREKETILLCSVGTSPLVVPEAWFAREEGYGAVHCLTSDSEKGNKGYRAVFDRFAIYLEELELVPQGCKTSEERMKYLIGQSGREVTSQDLKLATAETMAWLHYARRFIQKPKKND